MWSMRQHFQFENGRLENIYDLLLVPRDVIWGIISCHKWDFQGNPTGTRAPNTQRVLLVPATSTNKPGGTREYPGWVIGKMVTPPV